MLQRQLIVVGVFNLDGDMWKFLFFVGCVVVASAIPADYKIYDPERAEELANEFQGDMIISQEELERWNGRIDDNLRWKNHIVPYWINMTYFSEF